MSVVASRTPPTTSSSSLTRSSAPSTRRSSKDARSTDTSAASPLNHRPFNWNVLLVVVCVFFGVALLVVVGYYLDLLNRVLPTRYQHPNESASLDVIVPGPLTALVQTAVDNQSISVAWMQDDASTIAYQVGWRLSSSGAEASYMTAGTTDASTTVFTVTGLLAGTAYDVRVTPANARGTGTPMSLLSVVTAAAVAPYPPTSVQATAAGGPGGVAVSWAASAGVRNNGDAIDHYTATLTNSSSGGKVVMTVDAFTLTAQFVSLSSGTYTASVVCQDTLGLASASAVSAPLSL